MSGARILVVEDDRIVARDIEQQLLRLGYVVTGLTARGDAAVLLATSTSTDLVLMDIRVQGPVDGVEAARQIRETCQIPVVFLTAYADDETVRRASTAEPFGYVLKPFEDTQLHTVIGMALYKHAAEQRLRASEQRYAVTLASIGDAVISTDASLAVTFMNPAAARLTGWAATAAVGHALAGVFTVADIGPVHDVLASGSTATRTGASVLHRRDGASFVIDETIAPILDARGEATGVVLVFRDVTARRAGEHAQALAAAEQYWRTLTESLPSLIWTTTAAGVSDFFSPQCYTYLGIPENALIGTGLWIEMVHPDDRERGGAEWEYARVNELRYDSTFRLRRHDGVYRWFNSVGVPMRDAAGRVTKWYGTATDITERVEAEAAMAVAVEAAERASRAKNQFLANMSHELRTPLNGILGYAQILRRDGGLTGRQLGGIDVIEQSGDYLLTLINDILDFSRIEASKLTLELSDFRLEKFLAVIVDMMRMRARDKGIELACTLSGLPLVIRADERRLRQVLLNLLANAVRFTDAGEVRLHVVFDAPATLRFAIEDTGIGIAPDALESIFEPFEQAGAIPRRSGGAGLGLAISRQLVRLMGADISVASEEGAGSRFWFDLQVDVVQGSVDAALVPVVDIPLVTGYEGARKRVLVADDVRANRLVVIQMLDTLGFLTVAVDDGAAALACIARAAPDEPVDLVLMDAVMPVMDGVEAIAVLKADPRHRHIPVIAISANVSGQNRARCLAAGADAFLDKPLNLNLLLEQIERLLGLRWLIGSEPAPAAVPMVYPPADEIDVLHQLALQGNMRDLALRADHLFALDPRYGPFAQQVHGLATGFQSRAALRLIEAIRKER